MSIRTKVERRYTFQSAHWLPMVAETHKCHRRHGHSYVLIVTIEGVVNPKTGMVMDFADLDEMMAPLILTVDHRELNDVPGLHNPTAELICIWFASKLMGEGFPTHQSAMIRLDEIRVYEEYPGCCAVYRVNGSNHEASMLRASLEDKESIERALTVPVG